MRDDAMRHNGDRSPDEILAGIERTRNELDSTLHAIERRLTPGELVDQGLDYLRGSGANEFVSNLGTSAKNNPMPVALVSIGLAWLMAANKSGANKSGETAYASTGDMKQRASGAAASAKDSMSRGAHAAQERLGETTQAARERLSQGVDAAREQMHRVRGGYEHLLQEQPLAVGAVGLAIGALLAAIAPRTRKEDELMGGTADRLKEQAKEAGREQLDKAKTVATAAKDAATDETRRQTQSPQGPQTTQPSGQKKPEPPLSRGPR